MSAEAAAARSLVPGLEAHEEGGIGAFVDLADQRLTAVFDLDIGLGENAFGGIDAHDGLRRGAMARVKFPLATAAGVKVMSDGVYSRISPSVTSCSR